MITSFRRRRQRGSAFVVLLVTVAVCGALSAAVLVTNSSRASEARTELARERALHLAEAAADWAIARVRILSGSIPSPAVETRALAGAGQFTCSYASGTANGRDDNGNGITDEPSEGDFVLIRATGQSDRVRRTVEVVLRRTIQMPTFRSAVDINVAAPIVDLRGASFRIAGEEHLIDGTLDSTRPALPGLGSPAAAGAIVSQISARNSDQVTGSGGVPSVAQIPAIDLDLLMQQSKAAATIDLASGVYGNLNLGTPTAAGVQITYCRGDLHVTGNGVGAGVLAVDGDLVISGDLTYVGIVLVRGAVRVVGGGASIHLIGALAADNAVTNVDDTTTVVVAGTSDLFYSSDAVTLASTRFATMQVMAWREVGNP